MASWAAVVRSRSRDRLEHVGGGAGRRRGLGPAPGCAVSGGRTPCETQARGGPGWSAWTGRQVPRAHVRPAGPGRALGTGEGVRGSAGGCSRPRCPGGSWAPRLTVAFWSGPSEGERRGAPGRQGAAEALAAAAARPGARPPAGRAPAQAREAQAGAGACLGATGLAWPFSQPSLRVARARWPAAMERALHRGDLGLLEPGRGVGAQDRGSVVSSAVAVMALGQGRQERETRGGVWGAMRAVPGPRPWAVSGQRPRYKVSVSGGDSVGHGAGGGAAHQEAGGS